MDISLEDLKKVECFQMSEFMFEKAGALQKLKLNVDDAMALFAVALLSGGIPHVEALFAFNLVLLSSMLIF